MTKTRVINSDPTPGQYIRELHVWIATYQDGTEGIIASGLEVRGMSGLGATLTPLMSSHRHLAEALEPKARQAQRAVMHQSNHMVSYRMVTFTSTEGTRQ